MVKTLSGARAAFIILAAFATLALFLGGERAAAGTSEGFETWLSTLKQEALEKGISPATIEAAFAEIQPIPRIIELDRAQPEFTWTYDKYLSRVVSAEKVRKGRAKLAENRALLEKIGEAYGVQPRFIVALWGIETDYGRIDGGFSVVAALATLAHDGRRSAYFRKELLNALQILEEGHITPAAMKGSWAGAMGQPQFMPSSFLNFAVDFDGDGRRDIWKTPADVFASAANYLAKSGWNDDLTWGRRVQLPAAMDPALVGLEHKRPLAEWQALGVRRANGSDLPQRPITASLVLADDTPDGPAFLVYDNYRSIMAWNRSHYFATAVGQLADQLR